MSERVKPFNRRTEQIPLVRAWVEADGRQCSQVFRKSKNFEYRTIVIKRGDTIIDRKSHVCEGLSSVGEVRGVWSQLAADAEVTVPDTKDPLVRLSMASLGPTQRA